IRRGQNPLDEGGLVSLIATPEQRGVLGQVQALMSLLEGHGNIVMTELGRKHVAGADRMARVLHQRRQRGGLVAQLHKMLGLELAGYRIDESSPDLIVLAMPDASPDLFGTLASGVPVLGVVGPQAWELGMRAAIEGAVRCIAEPADPGVLVAAVDAVLGLDAP